MKIVIVGNGMAGFRLCEALAQAGRSGDVTVFGEDRLPAYDRVHLSEYLTKPEVKPLLLAPRDWYAERGIELLTGDPIVAIDRTQRVAIAASGREVVYDRLVLATGSSPFEPPIDGRRGPGVFVYRTIDDLDAIRERASVARRAVVIGGGLLGLEAARGLQQLGLEVTILEAASHLMPRQLDSLSAATLQRHVEGLGIRVVLNAKTQRIHADPYSLRLNIAGAETVTTHLVVLAAGVRPRDELARRSGLKVGHRGGVMVDDEMITSDPRILAIGECASHAGVVYGLVRPCYEMARVAAGYLTGETVAFRGGDTSWRLKLAGVDAAVVGDFAPKARRIAHGTGRFRRSLALEGQQLTGVCSIGNWPELWRMGDLVERRAKLSKRQLDRFRRTGRLWHQETLAPVAQWSATSTVCNCRNVCRGELTKAIERGCRTEEALSKATGAGTVCGSCRPFLAELCSEAPRRRKLRGNGTLWRLSLLAMVGCALMVWPWQAPLRVFEDPKLTGFGLLGATSLALLLSLRKRVRWFKLGSFSVNRALHAGIGVLALGMMAVHTGAEIGDNFNRMLALTFLGVVGTGALTGVIAAIEAGGSGGAAMLARRYRRPVAWSHWLLLWILPVLVAFHVVTAYYF